MSIEIRAMSFSEVLDQSFRALRSDFTVLIAISAVMNVPFAIAQSSMEIEPGTVPGATFWLAWGALMFGVMLVLPWTQIAIIRAISESALGRSCTITRAYRDTLSRYPSYLGTYLLFGLGLVVGFLLLIIPGLYLAGAWMLMGPIVIVERTGGTSALRRSYQLVRGSWWKAFGAVFLASVATSAIGGGFQFVFAFIPVAGPVLSGLVQSVIFAFTSVVIVALYFDLRCRAEDFDLQLLAEGLGDAAETRAASRP